MTGPWAAAIFLLPLTPSARRPEVTTEVTGTMVTAKPAYVLLREKHSFGRLRKWVLWFREIDDIKKYAYSFVFVFEITTNSKQFLNP